MKTVGILGDDWLEKLRKLSEEIITTLSLEEFLYSHKNRNIALFQLHNHNSIEVLQNVIYFLFMHFG